MYEWDPGKAARNLAKHGVDFADAVGALEDDLALTIQDPFTVHEQRFVTLGVEPAGRLLTVVYTWRAERIRIISARLATGREKRAYEERS